MMQDIGMTKFIGVLSNAASTIEGSFKDNKRLDLSSLRTISSHCKLRLNQSSDKTERFVCFFLQKYIYTFFTNLGGDVLHSEVIRRGREDIAKIMVVNLRAISTGIKNNQKAKILDACAELVWSYSETIKLVNTQLSEWKY